jgi:hypothetical protein
VNFCPPSLLLCTSTSALLATSAVEAGDAWAIFFPPSLLPCTSASALPGTGATEAGDARTGDAIPGDAKTRDFKTGLPKLGLANPGLSKTLPPNSGPHDFRGNFVSQLDEPCFAGGCRVPSWQGPLLELLIHKIIQA